MTQRLIAEYVRANNMARAERVAVTIADTRREAVEQLVVRLYDQTNGGGIIRWCEPDAANDAAATLLALLAERDVARLDMARWRDECERLRRGGSGRGQTTPQWCAEAVEMMAQRDAARAEIAALRARLAEMEGNRHD